MRVRSPVFAIHSRLFKDIADVVTSPSVSRSTSEAFLANRKFERRASTSSTLDFSEGERFRSEALSLMIFLTDVNLRIQMIGDIQTYDVESIKFVMLCRVSLHYRDHSRGLQ